MWTTEYIEQTDSTNNLLKARLSAGEPTQEGHCIYAGFQTAGRGQRGNGWESEQGKNLTFSLLLKPRHLQPQEQFALTEVITVGIQRALKDINIKIKWPNDIYVGDKKLAGILVENVIGKAGIQWSVIGVGLNVNQEVFKSQAPNPVSLKQLTYRSRELKPLLKQILEQTALTYELTKTRTGLEALHKEYIGCLYRYLEWYRFKEVEVMLKPIDILTNADGSFEGKIIDVLPNGQLCLQLKDGQIKKYHFKEIKYIIEL